MAIVIPKNLTKNINSNIESKVQTIVSSFGLENDSKSVKESPLNLIFIYILIRQPISVQKQCDECCEQNGF
jgi:ABC-2 type transport system permease protein